MVLIVPSGIETVFLRNGLQGAFVLIVPSGIETSQGKRRSGGMGVLIVPSGIETLVDVGGDPDVLGINCT